MKKYAVRSVNKGFPYVLSVCFFQIQHQSDICKWGQIVSNFITKILYFKTKENKKPCNSPKTSTKRLWWLQYSEL